VPSATVGTEFGTRSVPLNRRSRRWTRRSGTAHLPAHGLEGGAREQREPVRLGG